MEASNYEIIKFDEQTLQIIVTRVQNTSIYCVNYSMVNLNRRYPINSIRDMPNIV